jgi:hypothetical protein
MAGVFKAVDSVDFFVQARDSSLLSVAATATGTQTGADQQITQQRGIILNPVFTTIAATCTVRFTVQGKDDVSGLYYAITSLSLDGLTTGNIGVTGGILAGAPIKIYPGYTGTPVSGTGVNDILPAKIRVLASITATASGGGAATSFSVNAARVM